MTNIKNKKRGFILVEALIAVSVFVLMASALVSLILGSFNLIGKGSDYAFAANLSQEGIEAVKFIKSKAWNELILSKSALSYGDSWGLAGENTEERIAKFNRYLLFTEAHRDSNNNLVEGSLGKLDSGTVLVESVVNWEDSGKTLSISNKTILTNWDSLVWQQDSWTGTNGQEIYLVDSDYYFSSNLDRTDGLSLERISTSSLETLGTLESSAFGPVSLGVFSMISWEEIIPSDCPECRVLLQIKAADDSGAGAVNWSDTWSGPKGEDGDEIDYFEKNSGEIINKNHNGKKWIKYRAILEGDGTRSPQVNKINIFYK